MLAPLKAFIRRLLTLGQLSKLKSAKERTFIIALVSAFDALVSGAGAIKLRITLGLDLPALRNPEERRRYQELCRADKRGVAFVEALAEPGNYHYEGPPFRWPSAGYLAFLKIDGVRYCVMFLDKFAGCGWNLPVGAAVNKRELWHTDELAESELKKELIVVNRARRFCYRLEIPGGDVPTRKHYKLVLKLLRISYPVNVAEPLVATVQDPLPDSVHVFPAWEKDHNPHPSQDCLLIFNPTEGEMGIEYIRVAEFVVPNATLDDLAIYDGEVCTSWNPVTQRIEHRAIQRAVGLFEFERLLHELHKPDPQPQPDYVFHAGQMLAESRLAEFLKKEPLAHRWCPLTLKVLYRYFIHVLGLKNRICRTGDVWSIRFDGKSCALKDSMGMRYIAYLLEHQGEAVHCTDLAAQCGSTGAGATNKIYSEMSEPKLADEGLSLLGTEGPELVSDLESSSEYRSVIASIDSYLRDLEADLKGAQLAGDARGVADLEKEITVKKDERKKFVVAANNRRVFGNTPAERTRERVKRAIDRAKQAIHMADTNLWLHLRDTLSLGHKCMYQPAEPIVWRFN